MANDRGTPGDRYDGDSEAWIKEQMAKGNVDTGRDDRNAPSFKIKLTRRSLAKAKDFIEKVGRLFG